MFKYPDHLDFSVVWALDSFIRDYLKGAPVVILSDYRPGDPKQHGLGRAVDFTVPGMDSLSVWTSLRAARLFSGLGIYLNDLGAVSFHVDTRLDVSVNTPDTWGDFITHPFDPDLGEHVRKDQYTTAELVIATVKKNALSVLLGIALTGSALWFWIKRKK